MKIAILGAAGVRTPLIVQSIARRQARLNLSDLALMDIDADRLELIGALTRQLELQQPVSFKITRTTDARQALSGADFVITTFRVGGIAARLIDERVPLESGILGQETTGPGGFAMALRTIPVLISYIHLMEEMCPTAWLINFANPAGMLVEAALRSTGWQRIAGICDAPSTMWQVAAAVLRANPKEIYLDYFGLNHLGWVKSVRHQGKEYLPHLLSLIQQSSKLPYLPFDPVFLAELGLIPNEYLFYYYHSRQAVENILRAGHSRGEHIAELNERLFASLRADFEADQPAKMLEKYQAYLNERGGSYMQDETGHSPGLENLDSHILEAFGSEGYAGVALDLIEGLSGSQPLHMILNIPNRGAIEGFTHDDVVEIPAYVNAGLIQPLAVGSIPDHCRALMNQVKSFERLTIEAALQGSFAKAVQALTIHPLVADHELAVKILKGYMDRHGSYFPRLA